MRAASTLALIGTALWVSAPPAHALGFGSVANATQLGQPLNFVANVHLDPDDTLPSECVFADVVSGDNKLLPGQVRVWLDAPSDGADRKVHVSTVTLIDEPVVKRSGSSPNVQEARPAKARAGAVRSRCAW